MEPTTDKKSNGALIGAVVVIILLILGGVYLWSTQETVAPETNTPENTIETSNEAAVIQAGLDELEQMNDTSSEVDFTADINTVQ
jgi:hypothetical protein